VSPAGPVTRLLAPAPAERLAAFRIAVCGYVVVWSLVRLPAHVGHVHQPAGRWQPVGVLAPLDGPPAAGLVIAVAVATPLLGLVVAAGRRHRVSAPALAAVVLVVTTLDSSWGQVFHTENLMVLHVVILALAPAAADVWTLRRRPTPTPTSPPAPAPDGRYGWPLRVAAVVVVVAYALAGVAKLRASGLGWASGDVLRNLVAHDNLRKSVLGDQHSAVGAALVRHGWVFPPLAVGALVVELGGPVALLRPRLRVAWAAAAWLFQLGVLLLMAIVFPYQLSGVAFAPFLPLERIPRLVTGARRRLRGWSPWPAGLGEEAVALRVPGGRGRGGRGSGGRARGAGGG